GAPQSAGQGRPAGSPSRTVGQVYAVNTIGAIAGAFASGFILIPWLGLLQSLRVCVAINFIIAGALFLGLSLMGAEWEGWASETAARKGSKGGKPARASAKAPRGRRARSLGAAVAALLVLIVVFFAPPWDIAVMSSAVYRYAPSISKMSRKEFFAYSAAGSHGPPMI